MLNSAYWTLAGIQRGSMWLHHQHTNSTNNTYTHKHIHTLRAHTECILNAPLKALWLRSTNFNWVSDAKLIGGVPVN